jgi:tetratricopeptide (TPR) repeat protein
MRGMILTMKRSNEARSLPWRSVLLVMMCALTLSGCLPKTVPLASLPMDHPKAADLNLKGIDRYQAGHWAEAFELFYAALQIDPDFVEAHFNAALALHQMDRHEEATRHFQRAGELAPRNEAIVNATLYRNHLGLSSTLERHLSGGYRYQR